MNYKSPQVEERFKDLHKTAQEIALFMDDYFHTKYGRHLTMTSATSTLAEDVELGRLSSTHRDRRAFDIRTEGLEESEIADLIAVTVKKYGKYGAVVSAVPELIVNKPHGTGPHLHVQLNRKYALPTIAYGG